jgi:glycosyltransferase involved in cell wall biosynthesis
MERNLPGRLAYLISRYPTTGHSFILREVRRLRALGWDIQTVAIRGPDRPVQRLTEQEAEEHARTLYVTGASWAAVAGVHCAVLLKRPLRYLATLLYALRAGHLDPRALLRRALYFVEAVVAGAWMERQRLPHAHVHFSSTVALLLGRLFPVSWSATIHGPDEFIDPVGFALREKLQAAAFVVAVSHYGRSQLMRFTPPECWDRLEVCRLGIDPEELPPSAGANPQEVFRVMCVARLFPVKGHQVLIEAVHDLRRQGRRLRLTLVGDGPERARLEARAAALGLHEQVVFQGWVNQSQLPALYRECDLFVLASFAEGIPVALMEAMALAVPCVATQVMGVPELIRDGVDGLLVAPADPAGLAEAMARLMDSPGLRQRLAASGRQRVLAGYNLGQNVARLSGIFQRRLATRVALRN